MTSNLNGVFIFLNKGFHIVPIASVQHFSCPYLITVISLSNDSLIFLSRNLYLMERIWQCTQSKWPWHSFVCSVALEDDQLHLILSCWCSIDDLLMIFFFVSPLYTDPHEHFNTYTPGQLFGINLSLFSHKIVFKLGSVWNATLDFLFDFGSNFWYPRRSNCLLFVSVDIIIVVDTCFLFKVINYLL